MIALATKNGDLEFKDGDLYLVDEKRDIAQCLMAIFSTRKGEFFLDVELGLDQEPFLKKTSDDSERKLAIREAAFQEERVITVDSIDIDVDKETRRAKIDIGVTTVVGEIRLEGVEIRG